MVFGVIYDETEKKKMLEKMGKVDKIESLGVLAGGLAHDFNNLLGGIFGNIEMALSEEMTTGAREYLKNSLGIYYRAVSLTRQLLTFAKGGSPDKRLGNVEKTVRESVLFALTGTSIVPKFNIDNDLASVEFDKNQISEVISNIAINAQQAMNGAGQFIVSAQNIEIADDKIIKNGSYVKISLKDSGPGISEEIQGKIFDPFFSTKETGSGLGLAMSYSVIKKHGGFLFVESSVGKGSEFNVFLPVSEKTEEASTHKDKKVLKGTGKILIMDDEDFIRSVVGEMIIAMGYTPITVPSGEEAVKAVKESLEKNEKISLALLDLTVPGGMGGAEAVKEIKKISPQIPVVASSGYSDDPIISSPKDHGFDDSLKKPFLLSGLSEVIARNTGS
jgi:nitrogen-specific signal transduction histidine kinase/CheY-like chemotaxis protein